MNYYQFHVGDYTAATAHLSALEDLFYRRAMDRYYMTESPLPADTKVLARLLRARSKEEIAAVETVVAEFFSIGDDGLLHNTRCDEELAAYRMRAQKNRENGRRAGRKRNPEDYSGEGFVYLIRISESRFKLGVSKWPQQRLSQLRNKHPGAVLSGSWKVTSMEAAERSAKERLETDDEFFEWKDGAEKLKSLIKKTISEFHGKHTQTDGANYSSTTQATGLRTGERNESGTPQLRPPNQEPITNNQYIPSATQTGAYAPSAQADPVKQLFDRGVALLGNTPSVRSLLGKWRKTYGDPAVIEALDALAAEQPSDPIPWMIRALAKRRARGDPHASSTRPSLSEIAAECEAQARETFGGI